MLKEISESKKDLSELQNELKDVQITSQEQKKSYEKQLKEEKKKRILPWTVAGISSTITVVLSVALIVVLL